jgi:hypothetical protein
MVYRFDSRHLERHIFRPGLVSAPAAIETDSPYPEVVAVDMPLFAAGNGIVVVPDDGIAGGRTAYRTFVDYSQTEA